MSIDAKRTLASVAFAALLVLSVVWPAPLVAVNDTCCHARLPVDDLSFLGREAPSYDVVFWCLAGLVLLAILQSAPWQGSDFRQAWDDVRATRVRMRAGAIALALALAGVATALIWRFADPAVTALAERVETNSSDDFIRLANRFGGGMNPAMIVIFFLVAGVVYQRRDWVRCAVAMAFAGAGAGIVVQVVKVLAGRTRPELWLGAFHHARPSATSFPSGHTVGAFALAGVLAFGARSRTLRAMALLLAVAVAASRVLAFRHWTSDVFASTCIGLLMARMFTPVILSRETAKDDGRVTNQPLL
jgi:membrane-associated phospholipid phosphatase